MKTQAPAFLRESVRLGLIGGVITLSVSVVGMVELFAGRELIAGVVTMAQVLIYAPTFILATMAVSRMERDIRRNLLASLITGLASALPLIVLIVFESLVDLRQFLPNVSPALVGVLDFGLGPIFGSLALLGVLGFVGVAAGGFHIIPDEIERPILQGVIWTLVVGLFSEILSGRLRDFFGAGFTRLLFTGKALRPISAIVLFFLIAGGSRYWATRGARVRENISVMSPQRQRRLRLAIGGAILIFLIILPTLLGTYLSEVANNVGIFILMGLGLNIVVGFAGLLDLGYVAFFAIGAYSMAVLTSEGPLGLAGLTFWEALPFCVMMSALAGIVLGIPVLRMRGDYLAIVTLGFGEIIRILALSDMLKSFIGGAQGVLKIPKPPFLGISLIKPEQFYYVILAGCLLAAFVSWRLSESRLGRQWMALREDEDVAEAMGIRLVSTKILAFAIGAAFSGLAGAFFASKLTSIFPHSFKLEISINVLVLIIIGGMGSLPGVVVGALILVGMPELLREFAEYRLLMYGALLVVMMLAKPEGFIPSAVRRRELSREEEEELAFGQAAVRETGD
jgi:branched-chain amino acid transport system permease protein